jgi:hypothetical protein
LAVLVSGTLRGCGNASGKQRIAGLARHLGRGVGGPPPEGSYTW